mgnify:CR=1 FL=1
MAVLHRASATAVRAVVGCTRALEDPALRVDAYLGLARVEADRGEGALALEFFDRAAALSPGNWQVYSKRGYFHYQRQEHQQALTAYRTALSLNPMSASLWSSVGGLHQVLGQAPEAIDAFTRSLAIQPSHGALSNLGFAQFTAQQYAAAASSFHQALAIDNSDYRVWANLGDALAADASTTAQAREPYEEALQRIDGYLEVRADDPEAMALRGWLLASLGQYDAARQAIAASVERAPSHGEVAMWCAQAMALIGDDVKARACLGVAAQSGVESRRLASAPVLRRLLPER